MHENKKKNSYNKSFLKLFNDIKNSSYNNSNYYDYYKTYLNNQKENNKLILQKINKYKNLSEINKNNEELNAHKKIWINYLNYNLNICNKIENDIFNILSKQILCATNREAINIIENYINEITNNKNEYIKYKNDTINDILSLSKSIKSLIPPNKLINNDSSNELIDNKMLIKNHIFYLKEKLDMEIKYLDEKEKELNNQVSNVYNKYETEINYGTCNPWIIDSETKKPCLFLELTCLNEEFKKACYINYIKFISSNMEEISKKRPNKKEFKNFIIIEKLYEEYMKASKNRFVLLQDRMKNELKISKNEAKKLIDLYHIYLREKNNYKSNIKTFVTQKNDMINEIINNFKNINEDIKKRNDNDKNKEKQLELIEKLHEKLRKWRDEKILKLKEEEKIEKLKKLEFIKTKKIEKKKKELMELKNKERLNKYYQIMKERERQKKLEEEELKKIEEIKQIEISKYNHERVEYRKQEYQNHLLKKQKKKEEEIKLKKIHERNLEKIRSSVAITAESDPERVKKPTISSLKSKSTYEKDNIFEIIGYSDKQFMKDKRIRITEELQKEGLLHSDYAKSIINQLTPISYRNKSEINFN